MHKTGQRKDGNCEPRVFPALFRDRCLDLSRFAQADTAGAQSHHCASGDETRLTVAWLVEALRGLAPERHARFSSGWGQCPARPFSRLEGHAARRSVPACPGTERRRWHDAQATKSWWEARFEWRFLALVAHATTKRRLPCHATHTPGTARSPLKWSECSTEASANAACRSVVQCAFGPSTRHGQESGEKGRANGRHVFIRPTGQDPGKPLDWEKRGC